MKMNRVTGATLLIAGTAIGAGMIALPMVVSKVGLLPGIILFVLMWAGVYYSSLTTVILNFRMGETASIAKIARHFSGSSAEWFCQLCFVMFSYALMVAYISGGASILQSLLEPANWSELKGDLGGEYLSYDIVVAGFSVFLLMVLIPRTLHIDKINRLLFFGLIAALVIVIIGVGFHLDIHRLPIVSDKLGHFKESWLLILPIVFTSFGFQLSIPSIIDYLGLNAEGIQKSLLWGSLIPAVVYVLWSFVTLGAIFQFDEALYVESTMNGTEVGHFIGALSHATQWPGLRYMSWVVTILAIVTSAIGVGLGLKHFWKEKISESELGRSLASTNTKKELIAGTGTVVIPYLISIVFKDAFMQALAFAGLNLLTLAVLVPLYLLVKSDKTEGSKGIESNFPYRLLENRGFRLLLFMFGLIILMSELINII